MAAVSPGRERVKGRGCVVGLDPCRVAVVLEDLRGRHRPLVGFGASCPGEDQAGGEVGEAVLGPVIDAGGIGTVFQHVDGVAVDEGVGRARGLRRGQQVAG